MIVHTNTMVKNEATLLNAVLPIWKNYPINKFVFYDDNSIDNTIDVITKHLGARAFIINDSREKFSESHNRSRILECSRQTGADYVVSIDCDELMSQNMVNHLPKVLKMYDDYNIEIFQYNVVGDTLEQFRTDPMYENNFRRFILPMKYTGKFDLSLHKFHTPRTPEVRLPMKKTRDMGFIHLQAINKKFYALKQLWYKHYEYTEYKHSIEFINNRYDTVVNNLSFYPAITPKKIIGDLTFDSNVFDTILEEKGYLGYIKKNYNKNLITFGAEYL